jgi:hypothetical protein
MVLIAKTLGRNTIMDEVVIDNKRMMLVTTDLCLNLNRLSVNPLKA